MNRAVIIKNGVVIGATNTDTLTHPEGLEMIYTDTQDVGDLWNGSVFSSPPPDPNQPMIDWEREMAALDGEGMNRTLEDVIDVLSATARNNLATETKDLCDRKKAKRAQKP